MQSGDQLELFAEPPPSLIRIHVWVIVRGGGENLEFGTQEELDGYVSLMVPRHVARSEWFTSGNGDHRIVHYFAIAPARETYPAETRSLQGSMGANK